MGETYTVKNLYQEEEGWELEFGPDIWNGIVLGGKDKVWQSLNHRLKMGHRKSGTHVRRWTG